MQVPAGRQLGGLLGGDPSWECHSLLPTATPGTPFGTKKGLFGSAALQQLLSKVTLGWTGGDKTSSGSPGYICWKLPAARTLLPAPWGWPLAPCLSLPVSWCPLGALWVLFCLPAHNQMGKPGKFLMQLKCCFLSRAATSSSPQGEGC